MRSTYTFPLGLSLCLVNRPTLSLVNSIPELEGVPPKEPSSAPASSSVPYEVDQKDVEILMSQANCSKEKAEQALKENNGDLINASMSAFLSFGVIGQSTG